MSLQKIFLKKKLIVKQNIRETKILDKNNIKYTQVNHKRVTPIYSIDQGNGDLSQVDIIQK